MSAGVKVRFLNRRFTGACVYLKELLRLLQLQGVLGSRGLCVVGWVGLVGDETVVRDHYRGREDWGGHEDGVAVDLLHGEWRSKDLLLQRVSADQRSSSSDPCTCVRACATTGCTYMLWEIPMLHWEGCEVTLLVGTRVCMGWLRSILQQKDDSQQTERWYTAISTLKQASGTAHRNCPSWLKSPSACLWFVSCRDLVLVWENIMGLLQKGIVRLMLAWMGMLTVGCACPLLATLCWTCRESGRPDWILMITANNSKSQKMFI